MNTLVKMIRFLATSYGTTPGAMARRFIVTRKILGGGTTKVVEIECPYCGAEVQLVEIDQTDHSTQFQALCGCGVQLTLLVDEE